MKVCVSVFEIRHQLRASGEVPHRDFHVGGKGSSKLSEAFGRITLVAVDLGPVIGGKVTVQLLLMERQRLRLARCLPAHTDDALRWYAYGEQVV